MHEIENIPTKVLSVTTAVAPEDAPQKIAVEIVVIGGGQYFGELNGEIYPLNVPVLKNKIQIYLDAYKKQGFTNIHFVEFDPPATPTDGGGKKQKGAKSDITKTASQKKKVIESKTAIYTITDKANSGKCKTC